LCLSSDGIFIGEAWGKSTMQVVNSSDLWTKVSASDLQRLAATQNLRGYAAHDEVFVWPSYDETHLGIVGEIGITEHEGIPFYVFSHNQAVDPGVPEDISGESDWANGYKFMVGSVIVSVSDENVEEIQNSRGFCWMAGLPTPSGPQKPRSRWSEEDHEWMADNNWDDASVDAYITASGRRPWDDPDVIYGPNWSFSPDDWKGRSTNQVIR
jgi:hypothetical protein